MNMYRNNLGQFAETPHSPDYRSARIISAIFPDRVEHERMLLINAGLRDDEVDRVAKAADHYSAMAREARR